MDELIDWLIEEFSPRMRGCFYRLRHECETLMVLPAYAGMFLGAYRHETISQRSPRVCGDVS